MATNIFKVVAVKKEKHFFTRVIKEIKGTYFVIKFTEIFSSAIKNTKGNKVNCERLNIAIYLESRAQD